MHFLITAAVLGASLGTAAAASAATTIASAEAESMTLPAGASVVNDTTASGGKGVAMTANGRLTQSISLPSEATAVTVRVRSISCLKSWPNTTVIADGAIVMASTKVASGAWLGYQAPVKLAAGTHTLSVALQKTLGNGGGNNCSPVLYVDQLVLTGPEPPTTTTETAPPPPPTTTGPTPTGPSPYTKLVWGDEFNSAAGTQPDPTKWAIKNGTPWNHGLNSYTNRTANVAMDGLGALDLTARRETYTGADGVTRDYTSGAILSKDRYTFTYGHIESRLWVPEGRGFWPAFWTLRWPIGAEIDIMEVLGQSPTRVHATARNLKLDGSNYWWSGDFYNATPVTSDYHVYGVTWQPTRISWQFDGKEYFAVTPSDLPSDYRWNYGEPEWVILNLGVGGDWPLPPTDTTPFPSRMKVDWVRVYQ